MMMRASDGFVSVISSDMDQSVLTQNGHAPASGWSYSCTIRAFPRLL